MPRAPADTESLKRLEAHENSWLRLETSNNDSADHGLAINGATVEVDGPEPRQGIPKVL